MLTFGTSKAAERKVAVMGKGHDMRSPLALIIVPQLRGNKFQEDDLCSPCFRQSCGVIYVISYVESVVVSTPPPHCTDTCYQETWGLVAALSNCQNDCKGGSNDNGVS